MICYRDKTFCATPNCGNSECDRRITDDVRDHAALLGLPIAQTPGCLADAPAPAPAPDKEG